MDLVRLSIHSFDRSHKIFVFFSLIQYSISMRTWWFLKRKKNHLAPVVKKRRFGRNGRRMFAGKSQQAYPVYSGLMTRLRTFVCVTCSFRGGERERELSGPRINNAPVASGRRTQMGRRSSQVATASDPPAYFISTRTGIERSISRLFDDTSLLQGSKIDRLLSNFFPFLSLSLSGFILFSRGKPFEIPDIFQDFQFSLVVILLNNNRVCTRFCCLQRRIQIRMKQKRSEGEKRLESFWI